MAVQVTFLGVTYTIPETGDEDWGDDLTAFLVALGNNSATGITLAAVGAVPNANAASLSGTTLNLQPANGSFPGVVTTGSQTIAGAKTFTGAISASNLTGTNTGDVTLTAVGNTPSANGASLSGQALTLQPGDATHPGVLTTAAQTLAGVKTFSSSPVFSTVTHVRANRHSSALTLSVGSTAVPFTTSEYDTQSEYNATTGVYTCKEAGYYRVSATVTTNAGSYVANDSLDIELWKNGAKLQVGNNFTAEASITQYWTLILDTTLALVANDTLQIKCTAVGHDSTIYNGATTGVNTFTIDRLY